MNKYVVASRLYCPFRKRRVMPGETIEVEDDLFEAYKPYLSPEPIRETKEELPKEEPKTAETNVDDLKKVLNDIKKPKRSGKR